MFKEHITGAIMSAIMRGADSEQGQLVVTVTNLSDIAEMATDDILNLIEERTARYYESTEPDDTA
jgi:hypothetical protein